MCEPLIGKARILHDKVWRFDYDDIRSTTNFYMKYKDNPAKLMKEQPEHYKNFYEGMEVNHKVSFFEYCFQDVI